MRKRDKKKINKSDWKYIFITGFLGYTVSVGAQLLGTKLAGSSIASLINSLNPVTMIIAGSIFLKEKLSAKKVAGIVIAFIGVCFILGVGGNISLAGIFLSLFAVIGWSCISVLTKSITQKYDALTFTRAAIGVAFVCNLPIGIGQLVVKRNVVSIDVKGVLGLLYMGIFCTGIAYICWNKSLSMLDIGTCSAFYPLQPLASMILGVIFLHEKVGISLLIGAVFIVTGMLLSINVKIKGLFRGIHHYYPS
jgi:Permeases of the drug/metabolite transporter (DMT) superfamily